MPGVVISSIQVAGFSPSSILGTPSTLCTHTSHTSYAQMLTWTWVQVYVSLLKHGHVMSSLAQNICPDDGYLGLVICKYQTVLGRHRGLVLTVIVRHFLCCFETTKTLLSNRHSLMQVDSSLTAFDVYPFSNSGQ